jgi:hypothetical protein
LSKFGGDPDCGPCRIDQPEQVGWFLARLEWMLVRCSWSERTNVCSVCLVARPVSGRCEIVRWFPLGFRRAVFIGRRPRADVLPNLHGELS